MQRLKATTTKLLSEVPEEKRDGSSVSYSNLSKDTAILI